MYGNAPSLNKNHGGVKKTERRRKTPIWHLVWHPFCCGHPGGRIRRFTDVMKVECHRCQDNTYMHSNHCLWMEGHPTSDDPGIKTRGTHKLTSTQTTCSHSETTAVPFPPRFLPPSLLPATARLHLCVCFCMASLSTSACAPLSSSE